MRMQTIQTVSKQYLHAFHQKHQLGALHSEASHMVLFFRSLSSVSRQTKSPTRGRISRKQNSNRKPSTSSNCISNTIVRTCKNSTSRDQKQQKGTDYAYLRKDFLGEKNLPSGKLP